MTTFAEFAAAPAMLAALSLGAGPVSAADLPVAPASSSYVAAPLWDAASDSSEYHRRYRYRRNRVDAGDVLAGVLIIGGIAAVASAANRGRDDRYRDRNRDYRNTRMPRRNDTRYDNTRGIDRAVKMCVDAIERDARVNTVDNVARSAQGWRVTGSLYNGEGFTCSLGANGRIEAIDYGARTSGQTQPYRSGQGDYDGADYQAPEDQQYDDNRYRQAWNDVDNAPADTQAQTQAQAQAQGQPAYPGGPLPGDAPVDQADNGDVEYGTAYPGAI
ncbi:hypothetical protein [Qipengyuania marisflavi]|uniref:Secreted protein n=1 Tax=Qipengyuania marisflavi TaxID=2486356 RepID=A0A5S3P9S4_9SPHN|nr:hypothetical protein [Qipengyuania marisflavi]TMM50216.1 hypothetical protein FEV51_03270 [Qipengyuania marisflavi]